VVERAKTIDERVQQIKDKLKAKLPHWKRRELQEEKKEELEVQKKELEEVE